MEEINNLEKTRHSLSHLLAAAVLDLYPSALPTLGPATETGFYYDFDLAAEALAKEDFLDSLEQKMRDIARTWKGFEGKEISYEEAQKLFSNNPYKLELIEEVYSSGQKITAYTSGKFTDLCRGGHTDDMSRVPLDSWKLDKVAGAYWRGDEKNKMLTRIYGLAFESKEKLDEYLRMQEEAKKRDHRKLGKELDLFTFSERIGSGLPLYTPKGALVRRLLNEYIEELQTKEGYTQVWTPQLAKADLFKISGHYDKYKDSMFRVVSNYSKEEFFLKPMNCPQHTQIYESRPRSYKDLPLRFSDFAMLYRDEQPGELSGLARVRSFSQDDCHIFCREDQVDCEIDIALNMTKKVMASFGFKYKYRLSTRDPKNKEKYLGDPKTWDKVEKWAENIMKRHKIEYFEGPGEAAFYAPKMDLIATDALGRDWQLSTVQIDFVMPERFNLEYTDSDGKKKHPVMIHRAIIGSPERFIMILLEHYAGAFPIWLSPVQARILTVSEKHIEYARKVFEALKEADVRIEIDDSNESLGKKVREAKMQKISYLLVVGDKEVESGEVTVESRTEKVGSIPVSKFLEQIKREIKEKK
jgi:threonyl-tRNA synthetase